MCAERRTLDIPEAGEILGLSRNAAYAAAKRGEIPTIRIGHRLFVPKAAFDRMLDNGEVDEAWRTRNRP